MGKERPSLAHDDESYDTTPIGEIPPNLASIPGVIYVNKSIAPDPQQLEKEAKTFREKSRDIVNYAREKGRDAVLFPSTHGTAVVVGAGVASLIAGVIIYRHQHNKGKK